MEKNIEASVKMGSESSPQDEKVERLAKVVRLYELSYKASDGIPEGNQDVWNAMGQLQAGLEGLMNDIVGLSPETLLNEPSWYFDSFQWTDGTPEEKAQAMIEEASKEKV